jgi:uncharacterized membrane protein
MRRWLDRLLDPGAHIAHRLQDSVVDPAWRRVTDIESFVPVSIALGVAVVLQATLADRVAQLRWVFVGVCVVLLAILAFVSPRRVERRARLFRGSMLFLIAVMSIANMVSAGELVVDLVNETGIRDADVLLRTGGAIWLTNVIVFSLWYWEFDRGGPLARAQQPVAVPDFLFPQMADPKLAPADWQSEYVDYLYLSFTNAMAFSPTDVLPLSRWSKLTMLVQSLVSLVIAVLVIARAVNILG